MGTLDNRALSALAPAGNRRGRDAVLGPQAQHMRVVIPGVHDLVVTQDVGQHVPLDLVVWARIVVGPHVQLLRWNFVQREPPGRVMPVAMLASGHDEDRVAFELRLVRCVDYVLVWRAVD